MFQLLEGAVPYRDEDAERYERLGWWDGRTLGQLLDLAADIHPEKDAFLDLDNRYTYGEARAKADRLAIALMRLGIRPLERVLVQLPNWTEFAIVYFALQKIGAIPVMLIDRYRQLEVMQLADLTGATAWVAPVRHRKVDFVPIIHDVLNERPQIRQVITVRGEVDEPGFASVERLIAGTEPTEEERDRLMASSPDARQVAHMGPTGGTTGTPKIVPRTHNSLRCVTEYCALAWHQHCEDINLIVGSIGHDLSFTKGFLGSVLTMGTIVMLDSTDAQLTCETIEREKVTAVIWVPTLAQRLLQYDDLDKYDLSSLKKMHSAGGAAMPGLVREVFGRMRVRFCNGYGATEGMSTITRPVDNVETVVGTVGRPTCPGDIHKVVDPQGNTLPPGAAGELLVKGPSVFSGYYRNPQENANVFDEEGFFKTGDVAIISEKGYITITGRTKEMINRGGESISATVIEGLIDRHPDVEVVAVVAMPDPMMGERACAYIQPRPGARLDFDAVIAFLRAQDASVLQFPERIEFIETMPYTAALKLDKNALRADIARKVTDEAKSP
ncbi:MAG: AMP-binding protein [Thermoleophilia bacterium]|nr:AMP-binding protein [Thermoleophilia bacterium]